MRKQLQINLFSQFNLARNLKTNFHSPALVGVLECDYLLSMPTAWILNRDQFINQFLRDINIDWVVIFQFVVPLIMKHNSFWRYKPVMISKRYPKFKELKRMLITETSSFHFHGASDLQYVLLRVFFLFGLRPKVNPPNFWHLSRNMSKATPQDRRS